MLVKAEVDGVGGIPQDYVGRPGIARPTGPPVEISRGCPGVRRSGRRPAPVHPVWWVAPRPAPVSPWKYSLKVMCSSHSGPVGSHLGSALRAYATAEPELDVEFPTHSGRTLPLPQVAEALRDRLVSMFRLRDGARPSTAWKARSQDANQGVLPLVGHRNDVGEVEVGSVDVAGAGFAALRGRREVGVAVEPLGDRIAVQLAVPQQPRERAPRDVGVLFVRARGDDRGIELLALSAPVRLWGGRAGGLWCAGDARSVRRSSAAQPCSRLVTAEVARP